MDYKYIFTSHFLSLLNTKWQSAINQLGTILLGHLKLTFLLIKPYHKWAPECIKIKITMKWQKIKIVKINLCIYSIFETAHKWLASYLQKTEHKQNYFSQFWNSKCNICLYFPEVVSKHRSVL